MEHPLGAIKTVAAAGMSLWPVALPKGSAYACSSAIPHAACLGDVMHQYPLIRASQKHDLSLSVATGASPCIPGLKPVHCTLPLMLD